MDACRDSWKIAARDSPPEKKPGSLQDSLLPKGALRKKSTFSPSTFIKVYFFSPSTLNRTNHLPQLFKLFILPSWSSFEGDFSTVNSGFAIVTTALSFSFLIISAEYLNNHSKSQKNYKMENLILLDST